MPIGKKIKIESPIADISLTIKSLKLYDDSKVTQILEDALLECIRHINKG
jgi:hypothetical protein